MDLCGRGEVDLGGREVDPWKALFCVLSSEFEWDWLYGVGEVDCKSLLERS